MRIAVTGATGLIGRAVVQRLVGLSHRIVALTRDTGGARARLGPGVEIVELGSLESAIESADAVVHLAGEPVIGRRWTEAQKERLVESRVGLTRRLAAAMTRSPGGPSVLVSASAVGLYGDRGDEGLTEESAPGNDFLAELARDWETAALDAGKRGARVTCLRIGLALSTDGGALAAMLPAFRLGLGGPVGGGKQYFPWIHLDDVVEMILAALHDERWRGPVNATAPEEVTQITFARTLGRVLGRPAIVPAPFPLLRLGLGPAARILVASQRARPARALELGYTFRHPALEPALRRLLQPDHGITIGTCDPVPESAYLRERRPTHHLRQVLDLPAPLADVFPFFSRAENLGLVTPSWLSWKILAADPGPVRAGTSIEYQIRLGPVPVRWRTVIEEWDEGRRFCDAQHRGPYTCWWHEHRFEGKGDATRVIEDVYYRLPLGPIGRAVHAALVAPMLRTIFGYRLEALRRLFPGVTAA